MSALETTLPTVREQHLARLRDSMRARHIDPRSLTGRLILTWADDAFRAGEESTNEAHTADMAELFDRLAETRRRLRDAQERIEQITERSTLYPRPPIAPLIRLADQTRAAS